MQIKPNTMSLEFGEGDFLGIRKLVWEVCSAYADAPEPFCNFSHEILSLYIIIRRAEDQLGISDSVGIDSDDVWGQQSPFMSLSTKDADKLKILCHG